MKKLRKQMTALLLTAVLLCAALAGCAGTDNTPGGETPPPEADAAPEADSAGEEPEEPAGNSGEAMEFTLYYTTMREQMEPLLKAFGEKYPNISVKDFRAPVEELTATMEMELRADNPQFDVLLSANNAISTIQERYDPFEPYAPAERDSIIASLLDEENIQIPVGTGFYVILYNTNLVTEEEAPKSWGELLDEKWMNKITLADPKSSGSVYGFIWYITQHLSGEPYGWEYFEELEKLNPNYASSHGNIGEIVALGERSVGVQVMATVQSSMAKGDPVSWVFPSDGMPSEMNVALLRRDTPNKEASQLFIDFLVSKEGQQLVADHLGYIPVRADMDYTFANGVELSEIELVKRDVDWIADNKEEVLDKFREIAG